LLEIIRLRRHFKQSGGGNRDSSFSKIKGKKSVDALEYMLRD
jgi:hypothetical protein